MTSMHTQALCYWLPSYFRYGFGVSFDPSTSSYICFILLNFLQFNFRGFDPPISSSDSFDICYLLPNYFCSGLCDFDLIFFSLPSSFCPFIIEKQTLMDPYPLIYNFDSLSFIVKILWRYNLDFSLVNDTIN